MTPHKQRFRHQPEKGEYGDCHRTAIACLLDLEPEEVPNFGQWYSEELHGDRFRVECAKYLASQGLREVEIPYNDTLENLLASIGALNPGVYYLLCGESRSGCNHTVIGLGDKIVWDPSLDDAGIVGPAKPNGYYWVTWHVPARFVVRSQ